MIPLFLPLKLAVISQIGDPEGGKKNQYEI
jgi:hypothetical protein